MLAPRPVGDFYAELMAALADLDIRPAIPTMPCKIADAIPFDQDSVHHAYDRDYAQPVLAHLPVHSRGLHLLPHRLHRQGQPGTLLLGQQ
jgi:hypothetical protein